MYNVGYVPDTYSVKFSKFKIKASFKTKAEAQVGRKELIEKAAKYGFDVYYDILSDVQVREQWAEQAAKSKELAAKKRAKTLSKRTPEEKKQVFVLCPRCKAKSKKLCSEMGGLQTRVCRNGHEFAYDTFGGRNTYTQSYDQFTRNAKPGF